MDKLLPCPFCGGEAGLEEVPGSPFTDEPYAWGVGCNECNIGWYKETETEAAAAWNRRAQPSEKLEPLTLDELIACVGKPIYLVFDYMPEHRNGWYEFLRVVNGKYLEFRGWEMLIEQLGRDVNAFRSKPKEEVL